MELWIALLKTDTQLKEKIEQAARANKGEWNSRLLAKLTDEGYSTIKRQLDMGGESPDYPPTDLRFRRADSALFNLILPSPLQRLTHNEKRLLLTIL